MHDHRRGYPVRAFPNRHGVWVQVHGQWGRPLHVWLYRGAWRAVCWSCMTALRFGDDLYDGGWRTQAAAFGMALAHCRDCQIQATTVGAVA